MKRFDYLIATSLMAILAASVSARGNDPARPEGLQAVDLGLSVKWASVNVGASTSSDCGEYYAWGETEGKDTYSYGSYRLCKGTHTSLTKYNTDPNYGTVDNRTSILPEDDAARAAWSGGWRMPTDAEWKELKENCTWVWTTIDGIGGQLVTGRKEGYTDKSIFLPAAGFRCDGRLVGKGFDGNYWSATLEVSLPASAWSFNFGSDYMRRYSNSGRQLGFPVRPVIK